MSDKITPKLQADTIGQLESTAELHYGIIAMKGKANPHVALLLNTIIMLAVQVNDGIIWTDEDENRFKDLLPRLFSILKASLVNPSDKEVQEVTRFVSRRRIYAELAKQPETNLVPGLRVKAPAHTREDRMAMVFGTFGGAGWGPSTMRDKRA